MVMTANNPSISFRLQQELAEAEAALSRKRMELREASEKHATGLTDAVSMGNIETEKVSIVLEITTISGNIANLRSAISRMASGTYGKCLRCGTGIANKRLLAIPTAALCRPCQETLESLPNQ